MRAYVEYVRGGGPRYHYNSGYFRANSKASPTSNLLLNNSLNMPYRDDFLDSRKMTRNQLRIITGIEMYYGNFDDLKYIYASKEIPELGQYIQKISELNKAKSAMTSVAATKGMAAVNAEMDKAKNLMAEINKLKTTLLENLPQLEKYKIDDNDLERIYSGGNS